MVVGVFKHTPWKVDNPIEWQHIIFNDTTQVNDPVSTNSGGCLTAGDTVVLGPYEAGTIIGFYMISNGFNNTNKATKQTFYSIEDDIAPLRPANGARQTAWVYLPQYNVTVFGFEDRNAIDADYDYNDVMFTFSAKVNYTEIPQCVDPAECPTPIIIVETPSETPNVQGVIVPGPGPSVAGAIAGASAAALAIFAALAYFLKRKKKTPEVEDGLNVPMANNAQANPFYEGATSEGANPLYNR